MSVILTVAVLVGLGLLSVRAFRTWMNPVAVSMLIWLVCLLLFSFKGIAYGDLSLVTLVAIVGFSTLLCGSAVVGLALPRASSAMRAPFDDSVGLGLELRTRLRKAILFCCIVSGSAIIVNFVNAARVYGISGMLDASYQIYLDREAGLNATAPLSSFLAPVAFTAVALVGVQIRRYGVSWICAPPVLLVLLHALSFGGRNSLIVPALCVLAPSVIVPRNLRRDWRTTWRTWSVVAVLGVVVLAVNSAAERATVISSYASVEMTKFAASYGGTYRAYLYATAPLAVLDAYLTEPFYEFGANTFFPIYSILSRLGYDLPLWQTLPMYEVPVQANVGTYLTELLIDFGWLGAMLVISLLGIICGASWRALSREDSTVSSLLVTIVTVLLSLSFFMWYGRSLGIWVLAVTGIAVAKWADRPAVRSLASNRIHRSRRSRAIT